MEPGNSDCQPRVARRLLRAGETGFGPGQLSLLEDEEEPDDTGASRDRPSASPPLLAPAPSWLLELLSSERCIADESWPSASMADATPRPPTHRAHPIKNFPIATAAQPLDPQSKIPMLAETGG